MLKRYNHDDPYLVDNVLLEVDAELGQALLRAQEWNEDGLRATVITILSRRLDHFSAKGTVELCYEY